MSSQQILGLTDEEYGEHLKYDRGHSDGANGNPFSEYDYYASSDKYKQGFKMGRQRLREAYQRSLLNDFGPVNKQA